MSEPYIDYHYRCAGDAERRVIVPAANYMRCDPAYDARYYLGCADSPFNECFECPLYVPKELKPSVTEEMEIWKKALRNDCVPT